MLGVAIVPGAAKRTEGDLQLIRVGGDCPWLLDGCACAADQVHGAAVEADKNQA